MLIPKEYQFGEEYVKYLKEKTTSLGYFTITHTNLEAPNGTKYTLIKLASSTDNSVNYLYVFCPDPASNYARIEYSYTKTRITTTREYMSMMPSLLRTNDLCWAWVVEKFTHRPVTTASFFGTRKAPIQKG